MRLQRACHDTLPWLISFSLGVESPPSHGCSCRPHSFVYDRADCNSVADWRSATGVLVHSSQFWRVKSSASPSPMACWRHSIFARPSRTRRVGHLAAFAAVRIARCLQSGVARMGPENTGRSDHRASCSRPTDGFMASGHWIRHRKSYRVLWPFLRHITPFSVSSVMGKHLTKRWSEPPPGGCSDFR
jgi:hypothetical protein